MNPPSDSFTVNADNVDHFIAEMDKIPPELDGFELDELIGKGGCARVFKGEQLKGVRREVAVKVLDEGRFPSADDRTRLLKEAQTLARFPARMIVPLFGLQDADNGGPLCLIMEFVKGRDLNQQLKCNPLADPRLAARLVERLARILQFAHDLKIFHRDLKPGNVLLEVKDGQTIDGKDWGDAARLADFGQALWLDNPLPPELEEEHPGTIEYLAPEMVGWKKDDLPTEEEFWRQVDVYGLGAILYKCLTGRPPGKPSEHPIEHPRSLNSQVPPTLEAICLKCLEKERSKGHRYQAAQKVADDLHAWLEYKPTRRRPLNPVQRVGLWAWRSPWQAGTYATLGVGLVVIGGIAWQLWQSNRQLEQSLGREQVERKRADEAHALRLDETEAKLHALRQANIRRYAQQLGLVQQHLKDANSSVAVAELNRCDPALRGWEWDYLQSRCDSALRKVPFAAAVQSLAAHPDGRLAVATSGGRYFGPWDEKLAEVTPLAEPQQRAIRRMWFMQDRLLTSSMARRGEVVAGVLDAHGLAGETRFEPLRELFVPGEFVGDGPAEPALLHDSVVVFPAVGATLRALYLASGEVRSVSANLPPITALTFRPDGKMLAAVVGEEVSVWEWPTMKRLPVPPQPGSFHTLAFDKNGTLALVNATSEVRLWRYDDGWKLAERQPRERRGAIRRIVFSPTQAETFLTLGHTLTVWEPDKDGDLRGRDLLGETAIVSAVAFSLDGQKVFSGDVAGTVREYNTIPISRIGLKFGPAMISPSGVSARIVDGRVELNGQSVDLQEMKPTGLAWDGRNGTTRLLIDLDQQGVIVVDRETSETVCFLAAPRGTK